VASLTPESNRSNSRMKKLKTSTPGGNRLRALRDGVGRTQLDVELDAHLGIGYLQRVESGKVRSPDRDTLERILAALGAHYTERRDILELFGYVVDTPLPDADETAWAVGICRDELDKAVFPVYLLDCAHRLLAWNAFVARLFPVMQVGQVSMLRLLFDPAYGVTRRIANPEAFFPAQIRALRYQMRLFRGEAWFDALIDEMRRHPLFERWWTDAGQNDVPLAARPLVPLEIEMAGAGRLRFRLTSEPFAQDRRFRVIYYLPADPATMQQMIDLTPATPKQGRFPSP
jgi:transcriptional regulator with XRE-family HTH domain